MKPSQHPTSNRLSYRCAVTSSLLIDNDFGINNYFVKRLLQKTKRCLKLPQPRRESRAIKMPDAFKTAKKVPSKRRGALHTTRPPRPQAMPPCGVSRFEQSKIDVSFPGGGEKTQRANLWNPCSRSGNTNTRATLFGAFCSNLRHPK
jgi:hypothetical protein